MFDNYQLKLAEYWEILIPEFNRHCVTMAGPHYGMKLVKWDPEKSHRWEIVGYQKAHHVLFAQREMMRFLRLMVKALLDENQSLDVTATPLAGDCASENTPAAPAASPKWDQLVQNGFFSFGVSSTQSIRASATQPFSAPPLFDPQRTLELVESMYRQSGDELEMAQTDPAYMRYLVRELAVTLYFERTDSKSCWQTYVDEIICNLFRRYIWWRQTLTECRRMVDSHEAHKREPSRETRMRYEHDVYALWGVTTEHLVQQILMVEYSLPFQRGFERNYDWGSIIKEDGTRAPTINDGDAFHTDKLFWSLKSLGFDDYREFTMAPAFHFRVLDHHLQHANPKERSRLSDQLLRQVSEMAVLDDIRIDITCDRSWTREPSEPEIEMPLHRREFISGYQQNLRLPDIIAKTKVSQHLQAFYTDHQWPKGKMDSTWLERAVDSRKHLTRVWAAFRGGLKALQQRNGFPYEFIDQDWAALSAVESPAHLQVLEDEKQLFSAYMATKSSLASENLKPSPLSFQTSLPDRPQKFVGTPARSKKKTRRSGTTTDEAASPEEEFTISVEETTPTTTTAQDVNPCIPLKPENLALFDAMFSTYKVEVRSYAWKHFLQAMTEAGFAVVQGSGSAVSFKKEDGVIVFHRPHPEPTIDPVMLSSMGKRLKKWFGWGSGTFVALDEAFGAA
ncbi:uncharacterized protein LTR77_000625 [Saxophila tyrrhenica]|uniref:Uncharacterized protein n=1 Tax=Saxophila tyrrhenica TaxID=1690608 RepID=A0AAV9PNV4_9PEZI|nr:hypothetical protein LTR77_000625 [Saxophila tyrrhenica]